MFRTALIAAAIAAPLSAQAFTVGAAYTFAGSQADLTGFTELAPIPAGDPAFTDVGIASITAAGAAGSEFYNPGPPFGAGRALFNQPDGSLVVIDEGTSDSFGAGIFTIDFVERTTEFGLRLADTSQDFITPQFSLFRDGANFRSITFLGTYNAASRFSIDDAGGFDRLVVSSASGTDGYGITDLTVGATLPRPSSEIPVPAALPLLATGMAVLFGLRRRRAA